MTIEPMTSRETLLSTPEMVPYFTRLLLVGSAHSTRGDDLPGAHRRPLPLEVQPGDLFRAQRDLQRPQAVVQLPDRQRTDQREELERLVQHPGQRDLGRGRPLLPRQLADPPQARPIPSRV